MVYIIEYIAQALKRARQSKNLSQRALSEKVKIPQAQISKIENSAVDLKVSTLINLARTLDLEVVLVPRKDMSAVSAVMNAAINKKEKVRPQKPAYSLDDEDDNG
ncbi:MAG: helix-turn-helix transcriptional regulator [Candidatus Thiodiazotropha endolucinida]